jgi:MFS superfamily sulfate permease-like transporter
MNRYGAEIMNFGYMSAPWADDSKITLKGIFFGSLKVAFVAVLETLISARIADTKTGTRFDQSKETFGMGLGNVVSGFFGGTPCTGVLVRTGVNIASGATDKISQFINSICVLVIIMIGMKVFTQIPMAVIASILITSSVRLIPFGYMGQLWTQDKAELAILLTTTAFCVFLDGAFGLIVGCFLSLLRNAANNNTGNIKFKGDTIIFQGQVSFVNSLDVENKINDWIKENMPDGGNITFDVSDLTYIDVDASDVFKNLLNKYKANHQIDFVGDCNLFENEEWYQAWAGKDKMAEGGSDDYQRF